MFLKCDVNRPNVWHMKYTMCAVDTDTCGNRSEVNFDTSQTIFLKMHIPTAMHTCQYIHSHKHTVCLPICLMPLITLTLGLTFSEE